MSKPVPHKGKQAERYAQRMSTLPGTANKRLITDAFLAGYAAAVRDGQAKRRAKRIPKPSEDELCTMYFC